MLHGKKVNSLIFVLIGFFVALNIVYAQSWWNSTWSARRNITINNTLNSNTLTDYQVAINLTYDSNMQPDFSDIRFTWYNSTNNSEVEIPYWIESKLDSQWAYVWVKVPYIPANNYATIYVYYGNITPVTSTGNATLTMEFYDDFSTDSRSLYTAINANLAYDAVKKQMNITATASSYGALVTGKTLKDLEIFAMMAIEYDGVDYWGGLIARSQSQTSLANVYELGDKPTSTGSERPVIEKCVSGTRTQLVGQSNAQSTGVFYNFTFRVYDNNLWALTTKNINPLSTTDTSFTTAGYFGFGGCDGERGKILVKLIRVRKYTFPEPTYSIGAEEILQQPPQITLYFPENTTYTTTNILVSFKVTDDNSQTFLVKVFLNNNLVYENNSYVNDTTVQFYINVCDGTHNITIFANDTDVVNPKTSQVSRIFSVRTQPEIKNVLFVPENGSYYGSDVILTVETYDVCDNVNFVTVQTNMSSSILNMTKLNNTHFTTTFQRPAAGTYFFNITVYDTFLSSSSTTTYYTIEKKPVSITLTIEPNKNVYDDDYVLAKCECEIPVFLKDNGVEIPNPSYKKFSAGLHLISCNIKDTQNYTAEEAVFVLIVNPRVKGCLDENSYAFYFEVYAPVTVNLTNYVKQRLIKNDLSDVWVLSSNFNVFKNITNNNYYLIILNTTNETKAKVVFGNYLQNKIYNNSALTSNIVSPENVVAYDNTYYIFFLNEADGTEFLPSNSDVYLTLQCAQGTNFFPINSTFLVIPARDTITNAKVIIYQNGAMYYRTLTENTKTLNFYIADLNKLQLLLTQISVQDMTAKFRNGILKAKNYLGGRLVTIHAEQLDVEQKVLLYLINGVKYQLYISDASDNYERNIGYLIPDPISTQKTIVITDITLTNYTTFNANYSLSFVNNVITFNYYDPSGLTYYVEFFVYDYNTNELLYYANSSAKEISFNYVAEENKTYLVKVLIHNEILGENTFALTQVFGIVTPTLVLPWFWLINALGGNLAWTFLIFILPLALLFNERSASFGIFLLIGLVALFALLGNIEYKGIWLILGLALFLGLVAEYNIRRREGK